MNVLPIVFTSITLGVPDVDATRSFFDDFGLVAAIEWQAEEFAKRTGIPCEISAAPAEILLNQDLAIAVFRIFQEALTNVLKHACASEVLLSLGECEGRIRLCLEDNGIGFNIAIQGSGEHWGQVIMRERAEAVGGRLTIQSSPGKGCTVCVEVPRQ